MCERELETEQNCNILTPTLMAISVVSFSFSRAAQPGGLRPTSLGAGFLDCILSPTGLQTLGVPWAPSARWWLSLPQLISNSSDLQLTDFLSSPSYIIVQSPTYRAEITVMQFTGHSLPVHQSMSVPWDFTFSHIVSQAPLRDFFS